MHRKGTERISRSRLYCLLVVKSVEAPGLPYPTEMTFGCGSSKVSRSPLFFWGGPNYLHPLSSESDRHFWDFEKNFCILNYDFKKETEALLQCGRLQRVTRRPVPVTCFSQPLTSDFPPPNSLSQKVKVKKYGCSFESRALAEPSIICHNQVKPFSN